ncbi:MAG: CHAT domain-containing protein [Leptolyngbya sp. Prado105]|jgi:CHAT domain-containing protein|nr:CHAT domain-containing protein [Leptolyngbya sp. Prado105]
MKYPQWFLPIVLIAFLITVGCSRSNVSPNLAVAQAPLVKPAPDLVAQALDRSDVAEAVRQIELRWKKQYEDYFQGKFTTQVLPAAEIAQSLAQINQRTGRKSALFYAIPGAKHLDLMLVTAQGQPIHRRITAANRPALNQRIRAFRMGVVRDDSDPDDYLVPGQQLYRWIITPLEAQLQAEGINQIIFCLGSGLRSLPLAALHDGQKFLIEKYNLAIIPAFNLLDRQSRTSANTEILAMGASTFSNKPPLPGVPLEISSITQTPWQGTSLLNQEFTLKNLVAHRQKTPYGIVHLATHAEFTSGDVNQSYIQFWDQQLKLGQLQELGLQNPPVQLLVLSACRTALGDTKAEMGFAGLAVKAGSKAAIASLWSVGDASTLMLMKEFYRALKSAPMKADALREAQLEMIRNSDRIRAQVRDRRFPEEVRALADQNLAHPYHWAAFTLIGNPW